MIKNYTKLTLLVFSLALFSSAMGASKEEAMSQYELGMKYLKGEGVANSVEHGFKLVKQASDQ